MTDLPVHPLHIAKRPAARALALPFETAAATAAVVSGLLSLLTDRPDVVAEALHGGWEVVWGVGYMLSGVIAFTGLVTGRVAWEALGLSVLAGAIGVRVVATVGVVGAVGGLVASLPSLIFLVACLVRTHVLTSRRDTLFVAATVALVHPTTTTVSSHDVADGDAAADDG